MAKIKKVKLLFKLQNNLLNYIKKGETNVTKLNSKTTTNGVMRTDETFRKKKI